VNRLDLAGSRIVRQGYALVATLLVAGCAFCQRHGQVSRLHELERGVLEGSGGEEELGALVEHARPMLVLERDGEILPAVDVYVCTVPDGHACRFAGADDTIHTTEFPERYEPVPPGDVHVRVAPGWDVGDLVFWMGDPVEMHSKGYESAERMEPSGEGVLALGGGTGERILYCTVKGRGDGMFKKYVWVVGPG
jgi:hypothetical protein